MEDYSVTLASLEHRISDPQKSNWLMQTVDFKNWEPNEISYFNTCGELTWLNWLGFWLALNTQLCKYPFHGYVIPVHSYYTLELSVKWLSFWALLSSPNRMKLGLAPNLMLIWVSVPIQAECTFFHCFLEISPPLWPNRGTGAVIFSLVDNFIVLKKFHP
jgi:hypothetical protein